MRFSSARSWQIFDLPYIFPVVVNNKKSQGAKSDEYGGLEIVTVLFLGKNNDVWGVISWCKRQWVCRAYLLYCFMQMEHTFKIIVFVDTTTVWHEFTMQHAIVIEEKSVQNLYIRPKLACFFQFWLFWLFALGWFSLRVDVIGFVPIYMTLWS